MLGRQKIILALLDNAAKPLSRTMFVKLSFLLQAETEVGKGSAFYDFVPYQFGPFSFVLYREIETLKQQSYVVEDDDKFSVAKPMAGEVRRMIGDLPTSVRSSVGHIASRYGSKAQKTLVRDVYARYPWYATKSELKDMLPPTMPPLPSAPPAVYTVGYERISVDAFFDQLLHAGIRGIADVRANPISRKYGFARTSLSGIAAKLGLAYRHFPQLGIPSEARSALGGYSSYQTLLDRYESEMLPKQSAGVAELSRIVEREPTALLCVEADVRCCHRSRLAKAVARETGLKVEHLS
jgi:uncharacterized protein (DUF488 family)